MMNQEIKARWLEKLRSGDYKQGTGYLKQVDGDGNFSYCCLGVLCEIAVEDGIVHPGRPNEALADDDGVYRYQAVADENDHNATVLPGAVAAWAGINADGIQQDWIDDRPCPDLNVHGMEDGLCGNCHQMELTDLNDTDVPFDKIADVIEKWF